MPKSDKTGPILSQPPLVDNLEALEFPAPVIFYLFHYSKVCTIDFMAYTEWNKLMKDRFINLFELSYNKRVLDLLETVDGGMILGTVKPLYIIL